MVPRAGVEPARPFGQRILSPQRLPFRHPGMLPVSLTIPKNFLVSLSHRNRDGETLMRGCSIQPSLALDHLTQLDYNYPPVINGVAGPSKNNGANANYFSSFESEHQ